MSGRELTDSLSSVFSNDEPCPSSRASWKSPRPSRRAVDFGRTARASPGCIGGIAIGAAGRVGEARFGESTGDDTNLVDTRAHACRGWLFLSSSTSSSTLNRAQSLAAAGPITHAPRLRVAGERETRRLVGIFFFLFLRWPARVGWLCCNQRPARAIRARDSIIVDR